MLKYKLPAIRPSVYCLCFLSIFSHHPTSRELYLLVLFHWFFGKHTQGCLTKRGNKKQKQSPLHLLLDPKSGFSPHHSAKTSPKRAVTSLALNQWILTGSLLFWLMASISFHVTTLLSVLLEILYYNGFHDIVLFWFPSSALLFQSQVVSPPHFLKY